MEQSAFPISRGVRTTRMEAHVGEDSHPSAAHAASRAHRRVRSSADGRRKLIGQRGTGSIRRRTIRPASAQARPSDRQDPRATNNPPEPFAESGGEQVAAMPQGHLTPWRRRPACALWTWNRRCREGRRATPKRRSSSSNSRKLHDRPPSPVQQACDALLYRGRWRSGVEPPRVPLAPHFPDSPAVPAAPGMPTTPCGLRIRRLRRRR